MSEYIKTEYQILAEDEMIQNNRESMLERGYTEAQLDILPPRAIMGLACGSPIGSCDLKPGMKLLDLGCGSGVDAILGGVEIGPEGSAIGLDFLPEMVKRAESCAAECASLPKGTAEFRVEDVGLGKYDFPDNTFDYAVSNCCICLVDQEKVFPEVLRILKPGGYFVFCEIAYKAQSMPPNVYELVKEAVENDITPVQGGAAASKEFRIYVTLFKGSLIDADDALAMMGRFGFESPSIVNERPYTGPPADLEMKSDKLSDDEVREYTKRLNQALKGLNVNDYMRYVTVKAKKPL